MDARRSIAEGMTVYTQDGEKLGKVVAVDDAGLFVEKGFFFAKEYGFRFDDVADVRDEGVHLRLDKQAVSSSLVDDDQGLERSRPSAVSENRVGGERSSDSGQLGTEANPPMGSTASTGLQWGMEPLSTVAPGASDRRSDSIQEGADARRIDELERTGIASGRVAVDESGRGAVPSGMESEREAGELKIHRRVVTEQKTVTVPVRREEVDVEPEGDVRRSDRHDADDHHVP
ncbi:MAG TPA: DUF2382 domain-containing protein [Myxococcaceae bacterium]|nr:DUF2382 domain-containing protein [Myxococcaceae bacterium]